jgi:hypothetical protein
MVEDSLDQVQLQLPTPRTKRPSLTWILWTLLLAPQLYVLSIGPVVRHWLSNAPKEINKFYSPLANLCRLSLPFKRFLFWSINTVWAPPNVYVVMPGSKP